MTLRKLFYVISTVLLFSNTLFGQIHRVIESNNDNIVIEFDFNGIFSIVDTTIGNTKFQKINSNLYSLREVGEPWLPSYDVSIGIPFESQPEIEVIQIQSENISNKLILPYPDDDSYYNGFDLNNLNKNIYHSNKYFPENTLFLSQPAIVRYSRVVSVVINPYLFNPVERKLVFNKKIRIRLHYKTKPSNTIFTKINDPSTETYIKDNLINSDIAKEWVGKTVSSEIKNSPENYWYNPNKNWYKIYLNEKALYSITFEELINAGIPITGGVPSNNLQIYSNEKAIPIEVNDGNDGVFNQGDFIRFVGEGAPPSPYARKNIYYNTGIYWFTYQADSNETLRFRKVNGYPTNFTATTQTYQRTDYYEIDSIYEKLGYAPNDKRDYWFWGGTSATNGVLETGFAAPFNFFRQYDIQMPIRLRVNLHGLTDFYCNNGTLFGHNINIFVNQKHIGTAKWDGQTEFTYETYFYASDSIPIFPDYNSIDILADGNICHPSKSDVVRINWFEFTYIANNRVFGNYYYFKSNIESSNIVKFWVWEWERDNIKIYVPGSNKVITDPQFLNDEWKTIWFVDTTDTAYEYFCAASDYYKSVDSIKLDQPSFLRDLTNEADYIIIYHPKLKPTAENLANMRLTNFPDTTINNPRIYIADVLEIYDEFSAGYLNPYAIRDFVKYAFENWKSPAPTYVVLIGDMSFDYRKILPSSRENFIPSIPYHSTRYGQAASDNAFVCVAGDDVMPELAIGRISIENNNEGSVIISKLAAYPADNGKRWKNNVLLLASGMNEQDENMFNFNNNSIFLKNNYLSKSGYGSKMIFRYPSSPHHIPYFGSTQQIREAINQGATLVNYYGHGGGYQWDLTFLTDDIYLLQNENRLPLVLSVTCYTAHFDNQDVFGEQFIKVPNKGAIGFFGSAGLTHWDIGKYINSLIFEEIFIKKRYISGKFFQNAKNRTPATIGQFANQVALLTYLGDPVAKIAFPEIGDYAVRSNYITIDKENPLVNDTITVRIKIDNFGIMTFSGESVKDTITVELNFSSNDTSGTIGVRKIPVFAQEDSLFFQWVPAKSGLFSITVKVNMIDQIPEPDFSDNTASNSFPVFSLSEPSIIKPVDGYVSNSNVIQFLISDVGSYVSKQLEYYIEIDTSLSFQNPIFSKKIVPTEEIVSVNTQELSNGIYFWRARVFDGENMGRWSNIHTFSINGSVKEGFYAEGKQMLLFQRENMNFSYESNSLYLNTDLLPPRPGEEKHIEDIDLDTLLQGVDYTALATDGDYFYIANTAWYSFFHDSTGKSKIYKFGTGFGGTIKGKFYGEIPNFFEQIRNTMFCHSDGFLYVAFGVPDKLIRINPNLSVNNIDTINVPDGMLRWNDSKPLEGDFYVTSDSQYIYNLTFIDTLNRRRHTLRKFEIIGDNMQMVDEFYYPFLESYVGICAFLVIDNNFYPYEIFNNGIMRRIRIDDGFYEEEWFTWNPIVWTGIIRFYAWAYDWKNNLVYATNFVSQQDSLKKKISTFVGKYLESTGRIKTPSIGMAGKWNKLGYDIQTNNSTGTYSVFLEGLNRETRNWDILGMNLPNNYDLSQINSRNYQYCRVGVELNDSSFSISNPIQVKSIWLDYEKPAELVLFKKNLTFEPDSLLQGLPISMSHKILNLGGTTADSVTVKYFLNDDDSLFFTSVLSIPRDSFIIDSKTISTNPLIFNNKISSIIEYNGNEYFTFNNITNNSFFVARDSVNPTFYITFDGKEIINGDIISNKPEIRIILKDNSPLQLDTSLFTIILDNVPLGFAKNNIQFSYTPYPNSEASLFLQPELKQGRHILDVLAKDSSGNFFDTTFNRSIFFVYDENDIQRIYNYPNPFKENTHFIYELRGNDKPTELKIKIFTIAGRLIKEITPPFSDYEIGFNKLFWDGKDQDGDEIANGVYIYRVIAKFNDKTRIETEKLVKMK